MTRWTFRAGLEDVLAQQSRSFLRTNKTPNARWPTAYSAEKDAKALPESVLDLGLQSLCLNQPGSFGNAARTGELKDGTGPDDRKLPEKDLYVI